MLVRLAKKQWGSALRICGGLALWCVIACSDGQDMTWLAPSPAPSVGEPGTGSEHTGVSSSSTSLEEPESTPPGSPLEQPGPEEPLPEEPLPEEPRPEELDGLPVIYLDSAPQVSEYQDVRISYRGRHYEAEAKLRGATSRGYPKKNYTLKFDNDDLFDAPDLGMGFPDRKKLVLTSTFDDNAYVRQRLVFELWSSMDPEHLQIHSGSAVLYLDGQYHGLYTVTDHVDRHLMAINGLASTGNLYKAVSPVATFIIREPLEHGLEKKEGLPETDFTDLGELITFVDGASDADFDANVSEWLDVRDYGDWWVFASIIRADDSVAKNCYHYIEHPGAPARFAPWDFNASLGQTWRTRRIPAEEVVSYRRSNRIFERLRVNPTRWALLRSRRLQVMEGVFHPDNVDALIDGYVAEIEASALRDWAKWEAAYRAHPGWNTRQDVTSYEQEVAYVRSWYREHWAAIKDAETVTASVESEPVESEPVESEPDPSQPPSNSDTPPL
jgi:hypothetical protein